VNKQHILDEIRRTAKANAGKTLGRERFAKETGISEGHWSGRYWARWSDAVKEAGLLPNQMNVQLDADIILGQLAALVRELGRFPVSAEMRMHKRANPAFPNDKVFERFGNRAQLRQAVVVYCESQGEFEDVAAICRQTSSAADDGSDEPVPGISAYNASNTKDGYVYLVLLKVGREKRYKIGKAVFVEQRTSQIALQLPEELELIHTINTDDAYGIESYWHKRFADQCTNGEWFQLSADDLKAFKRRKFM
jgi:Meiotically up-regulated gene 113